MLNLCWYKLKKIFECFRCFWKVFCFYKNWKISKTLLPCFGDSVVGHLSHEIQPRARVLIWRLIREWKVQSRGLHKNFRGLARNSLAGWHSSREKHLENFSQFCLWVFWRLDLVTCWRLTSVTKKACFAFRREFLKIFSAFSFDFLWLFAVFPISLSPVSDPITQCHTSQSPFLHHSFSNLQETGMGFLCLTWFPHVLWDRKSTRLNSSH